MASRKVRKLGAISIALEGSDRCSDLVYLITPVAVSIQKSLSPASPAKGMFFERKQELAL